MTELEKAKRLGDVIDYMQAHDHDPGDVADVLDEAAVLFRDAASGGNSDSSIADRHGDRVASLFDDPDDENEEDDEDDLDDDDDDDLNDDDLGVYLDRVSLKPEAESPDPSRYRDAWEWLAEHGLEIAENGGYHRTPKYWTLAVKDSEVDIRGDTPFDAVRNAMSIQEGNLRRDPDVTMILTRGERAMIEAHRARKAGA